VRHAPEPTQAKSGPVPTGRRAGETGGIYTARPAPAPSSRLPTGPRAYGCLAEQREDRGAGLVRLRQRGDTALAQDVVARHARRFLSDVRVADPALGRLGVDHLRRRQADGELQTVLQGADRVLNGAEVADRRLHG